MGSVLKNLLAVIVWESGCSDDGCDPTKDRNISVDACSQHQCIAYNRLGVTLCAHMRNIVFGALGFQRSGIVFSELHFSPFVVKLNDVIFLLARSIAIRTLLISPSPLSNEIIDRSHVRVLLDHKRLEGQLKFARVSLGGWVGSGTLCLCSVGWSTGLGRYRLEKIGEDSCRLFCGLKKVIAADGSLMTA